MLMEYIMLMSEAFLFAVFVACFMMIVFIFFENKNDKEDDTKFYVDKNDKETKDEF